MSHPGATGPEEDEIPAPKRRLDALARIITGGDVCAAITYYNGKIYIANNNSNRSEVLIETLDFLREIVNREPRITKSEITSEEFKERVQRIARSSIDSWYDRTASFWRGTPEQLKEKRTKKVNRFRRDLTKVLTSLTADEEEDKKFSEEIRAALGRGIAPNPTEEVMEVVAGAAAGGGGGGVVEEADDYQGVEFLWSNGKKHAEMVLADKVLSSPAETRRGKVYMGISKLCCMKCYCALKTLNETFKVTEGEEEGKDFFETRGSHYKEYGGEWIMPDALRGMEEKYGKVLAEERGLEKTRRGERAGMTHADDPTTSGSSPDEERSRVLGEWVRGVNRVEPGVTAPPTPGAVRNRARRGSGKRGRG